MLKKTTITILLLTAGLFGCSKMFQGELSNSVKVILTAKDTDDRMTEKQSIAFSDAAIAMGETITIDESKTYQSITGFGGSFTEASAYTLSKLSPDKRAEVIKAYFDPKDGNGYTLCRTHYALPDAY
jgi:glucosylceramidase